MRWQTSAIVCDVCGKEQISVHPEVCEYLECVQCHHMNPAPHVEPGEQKMDTRTGLIHELQDGESMADLAKKLNAMESDFVPVSKSSGVDTCPKCKGKGSVKRGFFSKRFKPCKCVM